MSGYTEDEAAFQASSSALWANWWRSGGWIKCGGMRNWLQISGNWASLHDISESKEWDEVYMDLMAFSLNSGGWFDCQLKSTETGVWLVAPSCWFWNCMGKGFRCCPPIGMPFMLFMLFIVISGDIRIRNQVTKGWRRIQEVDRDRCCAGHS